MQQLKIKNDSTNNEGKITSIIKVPFRIIIINIVNIFYNANDVPEYILLPELLAHRYKTIPCHGIL